MRREVGGDGTSWEVVGKMKELGQKKMEQGGGGGCSLGLCPVLVWPCFPEL